MTSHASFLALALSLGLTTAGLAQTTTAPTTPATPTTPTTPTEAPVTEEDIAKTGISLGETVDGVGTTYIKEEFGDWKLSCVRSETGVDPCQLYQLMQDDQGNSVAEINLFNLPPGTQAAAGASIVTPLETLLTAQLTLRVDNGQAKRYPFTLCASMGCVARVGFTEAELNSFRRGNKATLVIVPAMLPDEQVEITMSLKGFTAGYEAVVAANEAADKAAAEAAKAAADAAPKQGN
jgi:invasion protein IalB